jgi:CBS domain containing-hemolysin-like protein
MISVLVIVALLIVNGFFVAAEFAIVGAPRAALDARAAKKDRLARVVRGVLRDQQRQGRYIATAQIGVTVASLGLGMYGEHAVARDIVVALGGSGWATWLVAHGFASAAAIAILTYFHIVLGEMVPKSIAIQHAERIAVWFAPVMAWIQTMLYPLVIALNGLAIAVLKPFGIRADARDQDQYYTSEELQLIAEESEEKGAIRAESGKVLRELFEFGELTASEVMVPALTSCGASSATRRTRAIRSMKATSTTSSACTTSRTCCGCS